MSANDGVALAGCRFQSFAVLYGDTPMHVADESGVLQRGGDDADGRTLHAEHDCQKLMTQMEVLFVHAVVRRQQPTSAPLWHLMQRLARGRLHDLRDDNLRVASNEFAERAL